VAQSLFKDSSRRSAWPIILHETAALKVMLPWLIQHVAETEAVMGRFRAYGYNPTSARFTNCFGITTNRLAAPADSGGDLHAGNAGIVQDLSDWRILPQVVGISEDVMTRVFAMLTAAAACLSPQCR
jgi:hypothetical protein